MPSLLPSNTKPLRCLGSPINGLPLGSSPCAWSPATEDTRADEWIKVGYGVPIQLEGHTDIEGASALNMKLSYARVSFIKQFFIEKGIVAERIEMRAFGDVAPIRRQRDEESKKMNRRVELRIIE